MNKELQNNEKFIRCAGFIAEMIKKYGSEILEEQKDEENDRERTYDNNKPRRSKGIFIYQSINLNTG